MLSFPFDSHLTFDEDGSPIYDRAITSEPFRKLLKELFTTGIMPTESTNMQVTTGEGMNVVVQAGFAIIEGMMALEEENRTLAVQASDKTYDRIDTVVLRLDDNDDMRICDYYVVTGVPSAEPIRPTLNREGSIYEIGLADLFITKNATQILQSKITDTRYEEERCGVVRSISEYDTTHIYDQVQADLSEFKTEEKQEFLDWFKTIQDILDGDTAGHLQNEINAITETIGSTDISQIGDGTAKGAIAAINNDLTEYAKIKNGKIYGYNSETKEYDKEIKMGNPNLDYKNPLKTFSDTILTWTATQDCYLVGSLFSNTNNYGGLYIDGTLIKPCFGANSYVDVNLKIAQGQVITINDKFSWAESGGVTKSVLKCYKEK